MSAIGPAHDPNHNLGYKLSGWEKNVAAAGTFIGMWGVIDKYNMHSQEIQTPGTNTK